MPYIVVKNDSHILSRPTALGRIAPLAWYTLANAEASNHQDTITFETFSGADKCARMQGGRATRLDDSQVAPVGSVDDTPLRVAPDWGLGLVEVG